MAKTSLSRPLLSLSRGAEAKRHTAASRYYIGPAMICAAHISLNMSGPILLDWLRRQHGGKFRFSTAAMTFHAYSIAVIIGVLWTARRGAIALRQLYRLDMLWRFCGCAGLFACADILSFMSMQHLDTGSFSLVGKAFALLLTVFFARIFLGRRNTLLQHALVACTVLATLCFCQMEGRLRGGHDAAVAEVVVFRDWSLGLSERVAAVTLSSLAGVFQERLFAHEPGVPFMMQQCWMGCGAVATSFFVFRFVHGKPATDLLVGFCDWRVLLVLSTYIGTGLTAGLVVKRLGAVTKALCVPIHLGGCYLYAVLIGSTPLAIDIVVVWAASTFFIVVFAMSKAFERSRTISPEP